LIKMASSLAGMDAKTLFTMPWQAPGAVRQQSTAGGVTPAPGAPAPASLIGIDQLVEAFARDAPATSSTPSWLGKIPLSVRVEVIKQGEMVDRFDADEGLWTVVPSAAPPRTKPNGLSNSDAVDEFDRVVDAVQRAQGRDLDPMGKIRAGLSAEQRETLWRAVVRRVAKAKTLAASNPPTPDYGQHFARLGKDASQCAIEAEHPSVSRVHAQLVVGAMVSANASATLREADVLASLGVYLIDSGSANGTFVALPQPRGQPQQWMRLPVNDPYLIPPGGGGVLICLGASSRFYTVAWSPLVTMPDDQPHTGEGGGTNRNKTGRGERGGLADGSEPPTSRVRTEERGGEVASAEGRTAFSAADAMAHAATQQLLDRMARIRDAMEDELRQGRETGTQGPLDKQRFAALERDLVAIQVALDRRTRGSERSAGGGTRRAVVAVEDTGTPKQ
jgi:hypothetical protein